MDHGRTTEKSNKTKDWFFKKINEVDKPLAWLIKKNKKGNKLLKSGMKQVMGVQTAKG